MGITAKELVPGDAKTFTMEKFEGLNTKATRPGIEDQELSWCENWFPIGANNLRTMYGKATTLATMGNTIIYAYSYNLGSNPFHFICLADGTGLQINAVTGASTTISATANKFFNGTTLPQAAQWNNTYLQIIASTGYFIWDGTNLFGPGTIGPSADASLISPGGTYTSAPDVKITGGGGSGATATANVIGGQVVSLTVTNPGSAFTSEPTVQIGSVTSGGTTGGSVTKIVILNGGQNYTSAPTVAFTPASTTAATVTITGGAVTAVTLTNNGSGYTGQPTVAFSGGGGTGAVAIAVVQNVAAFRLPIMPNGLVGTCIENFQARAWIGNGNKIAFSAPNSLVDFSTVDGGGVFPSNDSTLRVQFTHLRSSNGFLYLYGDGSVQVVSNVSTSGSPATTTFNVANVDPQVGTPWRDSAQVYGRGIISGTTSGIYSCYGGAVEKVSDPLDGLFINSPQAPTSGDMTQFPIGAVANIFDIRCYMLLYNITDPFTQTNRKILFIWDGKKWFLGSQEVALTLIWTQEFNGNIVAWGTDGTNIFKMFQNPSTTLNKKVQGKLWQGDSIIIYKSTFRFYTCIQANAAQVASINVNVDTETVSIPAVNLSQASTITWVNNSGAVVQWQNNSSQNITWVVPGLQIIGTDVNANGRLLGLTINSTNPDETLILAILTYENTAPYA